MRIVKFNPIFSEFGCGLYATKDTPLTVVCDMTVQMEPGLGTEQIGIMFEFNAVRKGFSFPFEGGDHKAVVRNLENKDALPLAKKMLGELEKHDRCFDNLNGYVNFDKLAHKH